MIITWPAASTWVGSSNFWQTACAWRKMSLPTPPVTNRAARVKDLPSKIKIPQNPVSWLKIWPSFLKTLGLLTKRNAYNWLKETRFETHCALNHLPWWGTHPAIKFHTVNLMCFVIHRQELVFGTYITYKECSLSPLKGKQSIHNLQLQFQALYYLRNLGLSSNKCP